MEPIICLVTVVAPEKEGGLTFKNVAKVIGLLIPPTPLSLSSSSPPFPLSLFHLLICSIALLVVAADSLIAAVESRMAVAIEFIVAIKVVVSVGGSESTGTLRALRLFAAI
ncbi:hypothetical protein PIB30_025143 [Stylosanthes scabra]|uniref:Uncharacterized protein n=1 Tax=Stylosanthes scabra TaxID=79078 RepID=A0ABU6XAV2_9FABA|nr:hypothetical protein [Stylosanthes scabra]